MLFWILLPFSCVVQSIDHVSYLEIYLADSGVRHIIGTHFHVHLLVHTTCYIHHYLHEGLEVVVSIHLLHIVSQYFITEDVVILVREESGM